VGKRGLEEVHLKVQECRWVGGTSDILQHSGIAMVFPARRDAKYVR
jgi:hypothetical protein